MILFIDTTNFHDLHFALVSKDAIREFKKEIAFNENYKTNEHLQKFLAKHNLAANDIKKIIVCSGPGSFTGIRVGVSMSQAMSFALNIPLIAIAKSKIPKNLLQLRDLKNDNSEKVNYGRKPKITKSEK